MSVKLIPGKVYIRNTKNGRVYEYEKNLATLPGMERFTHEVEPETTPQQDLDTETDTSTATKLAEGDAVVEKAVEAPAKPTPKAAVAAPAKPGKPPAPPVKK